MYSKIKMSNIFFFVFLSELSQNKGISETFQTVEHELWSKIETEILTLPFNNLSNLGKITFF